MRATDRVVGAELLVVRLFGIEELDLLRRLRVEHGLHGMCVSART